MLEIHQEFYKWFKEDSKSFLNRHGEDTYSPYYLEWWLKCVDKTHKSLRELLGGVRLERNIVIESDERDELEPSEITDIVEIIKDLVPHYLEEYDFDESVFLKKLVVQGTHNAIKLSKHLRTYAQSYCDQAQLKTLDSAISDLNNLFNKKKTVNQILDITISTAPTAFALLGHYGPDTDSCFRQGSDRTHDKYVLGQTDNTFVIVFSHCVNGKHKNIGRAFGFFNKDLDIVNVGNFYFNQHLTEGNAIKGITLILEELWHDKIIFKENLLNISNVYNNKYAKWTFIKEASKTKNHPDNFNIRGELNYIKYFSCPRCSQEQSHIDWEEFDDNLYCSACTTKANICDLSKEKTFQSLIDVVDQQGSHKSIHPKLAINLNKCKCCHTKKMGEEEVCLSCLEVEFDNCDICDTPTKNDKLTDIGDYHICKKCVKIIEKNTEDYIYLLDEIEMING